MGLKGDKMTREEAILEMRKNKICKDRNNCLYKIIDTYVFTNGPHTEYKWSNEVSYLFVPFYDIGWTVHGDVKIYEELEEIKNKLKNLEKYFMKGHCE